VRVRGCGGAAAASLSHARPLSQHTHTTLTVAALASVNDAECVEYSTFGLAHLAAVADVRPAIVRAGAVAPLVSIMSSPDAAALVAADAAAPAAGGRDAAVAATAVADARRFASVAVLKLTDEVASAAAAAAAESEGVAVPGGAAGAAAAAGPASPELAEGAAAVVREGGVPALLRLARAGTSEPEMQYKAALALGRIAGALRRGGGGDKRRPPVASPARLAPEGAARPVAAASEDGAAAAAAAAAAPTASTEHARERTRDYIERALARRAVAS
jgi:hypothetical protein